MTIAVVLKVGDGVVLGADSASTLMTGPSSVYNVYFNAEKIWNVVKGLPVGVVTYGLGGLAGRSVASLAKDLRASLSEDGTRALVPHAYTVEQVASEILAFFFETLYRAESPRTRRRAPDGTEVEEFASMGFLVAGYSADAPHAEVWQVEVGPDGMCPAPVQVVERAKTGALWKGYPEALNRLMRGWSTEVGEGLVNSGIAAADVGAFLEALPVERLFHAAMPLQDAIDLVHFMVDVTAGFVRFAPGPSAVHPPTDSAAITRHEGFRWVRRKHYYSTELNLPVSAQAMRVPTPTRGPNVEP